jgi:hypothetical protein
MKKAVLTSGLLAIILLTTTTFAETRMLCDGKHCFIDLSNLSSSNSSERQDVKAFKSDALVSVAESESVEIETMLEEDSEGYMISSIENDEYYETEETLLLKPIGDIESKIIDETELPTSEFYCEDNTQPIYHFESDSFECA